MNISSLSLPETCNITWPVCESWEERRCFGGIAGRSEEGIVGEGMEGPCEGPGKQYYKWAF